MFSVSLLSDSGLSLPFSLHKKGSVLYIDLPTRLGSEPLLVKLGQELASYPGEVSVVVRVEGEPVSGFAAIKVMPGPRLYRALSEFGRQA